MADDASLGAACSVTILDRTPAMSCASGISFTVGPSLASSVLAQRAPQPLSSTIGVFCRRNRLRACRLLAMAREVTAQLWTMARSAGLLGSDARSPRFWRNSDICWASYWFTLQPIAFIWYLFMVPQFRTYRDCGQSTFGGFR